MEIAVTPYTQHRFSEDESCLVVPLFEKGFPLNSELLSEEDELALQALADKDVITGRARQCYFLPRPNGVYKGVLVLGLGKRAGFTEETLRRAAGEACALLSANRIDHVHLDISHFPDLPVAAFLEGIELGQYVFDVYRTPPEDIPEPVMVQRLTVATPEETDVEFLADELHDASVIITSTNAARHLANTGANEMTPTALAALAEGIARESDCECTVLGTKEMEALGMGALLAVARGSQQSPKLILLRYDGGDDTRTLAIVGKGVTFDSGGISIKPSDGMHEMKFDMCGAAAVLCTMMAVAELQPDINVVCVVPAVENMPGGAATRPGDIVRACNGKSIEIRNTDAEGRLILADAMAYAVREYKPEAMVDLATLTGACVVALGHAAAGLFATDIDLAGDLIQAGEESGDRVWQLPLWDDFDKLLETKHADLSNVGPREAGAITAAAFLKNFTGDAPWAHIDIAGTAWGGKNVPHLHPDHATGFGVRLLLRWILSEAGE